MSKKVSFPHMGDYCVPGKYLLEHILNIDVLIPPKITSKTIELGNMYSPEFVCMPFKFTLGTFIEALDEGTDVLVQLGGGCRYGYYSELQIKILDELGYNFEYINLVSMGKTNYKKIYKLLKRLDPKFNVLKSLYYFFITVKMIKYMDKIDHYIRANIGFEVEKNSFNKLKDEMLKSYSETSGYLDLFKKYLKYKKLFKKLKVNKPDKRLRVGIIGELYTIMEPYANYDLEYSLAKFNIEVKRYTNAHYLLFEKHKTVPKYLKKSKEYIKYRMGADAADNIGRCLELCQKKYDGIIHIKSSFCTPEIGIMPILNKITNSYDIPILFFSFDANTSKVGIQTRIEAFYDMMEMRKNE